MPCETYLAKFDGQRLRLEKCRAEQLPCALPMAENAYIPGNPWLTHSRLGDDERVWCEVYRASGQAGGLFVLRDFDEVLLLALAETNLDFIETLGHFSHLTTYPRYAADIFEHSDEDDD